MGKSEGIADLSAAELAAKAERKALRALKRAQEMAAELGVAMPSSSKGPAEVPAKSVKLPPASEVDGGKKRRRDSVASTEDVAISTKRARALSDAEDAPAHRTRSASMDLPSQRSAAAFCAAHDMRVTGPPGYACPPPMESFASTPYATSLTQRFTAAGFSAPTATQAMAWPIALAGVNIVAVAKTGSGKTLGFLLPVFHSLKGAGGAGAGSARKGGLFGIPGAGNSGGVATPSLLVMAPTRELACQIDEEAVKFGASMGLKSACLYGGAPKGPQCRALRGGVDIVIGTPGRMQDMLNMGVLTLGSVKFLVLDEADRMLDMGFEKDIRAIIGMCPDARQTMLFTATWPRAVASLAAEFCPRAVQMSVGNTDVLAANKSITQHVEIVRGAGAKEDRLKALFAELYMSEGPGGAKTVTADHGKSIVFVKFKQSCSRIAQSLWDAGFSVNTLNGDMEQRERTSVIDEFKAGKLRVLVATDVAARGLDVKDVTHVFNYDFPFGRNGVEDYVHRIGRTGRAGATGSAYTFFDPQEDAKNAAGLIAVLQGAKQVVPEGLQQLARGGRGGGRGGFGGGRGGGRGGYGGGYGGKRW